MKKVEVLVVNAAQRHEILVRLTKSAKEKVILTWIHSLSCYLNAELVQFYHKLENQGTNDDITLNKCLEYFEKMKFKI